MTSPGVEIVLFDLGGVLVDVGGVAAMRRLASIDSDEELWHRWLTCPWVQALERGDCSGEDFAAGVVDEWDLDMAPGAFLEAFLGWSITPYDGADELVAEVQAQLPTGCLSNTNALQWEAKFHQWPVIERLDFHFLSFQLRAVKPEPELFTLVAGLLPVEPSRVLFLDDNILNVEAAGAFGFQVAHTRGAGEARRALVGAGILAP